MKPNHASDCLICGDPLKYGLDIISRNCLICGNREDSNASCESGHFICDACHGRDAMDLIESFCLGFQGNDAFELARTLMRMKPVHMHGPEHHFLVPAVLLTVFYNQMGQREVLELKLSVAKKRARNILGGFCGFYGACGAAIGVGSAVSLITDTTPLSIETWGICNLATSNSLARVARYPGPRCCKRDTYLSLAEGIGTINTLFNLNLPLDRVFCTFHTNNRECLGEKCEYYPNPN